MCFFQYDRKNRDSIFEYSKQLVNHSLREFFPHAEVRSGKGGLGQLVEELFFGYEVNTNAEADFSAAGVELKCTPLKQNKEGGYSIKERLVCGMINYQEDWEKPFEESHFYKKCIVMLLLFYLHQDGLSRLDMKFLYAVLWQLPEKDLLIMKRDYEIIIEKVRNGLAHTLSEGDTMYLGACRKGQKGDSLMKQHGSDIGAPRRAWSLKMAYMRIVLEEVGKKQSNGVYTNLVMNPCRDSGQLVAAEDLRNRTFDEIILRRFSPFMNKDYVEFCKLAGREAADSKQKYFMMANSIAGGRNVGNINRSEEFLKAGITMKTIRRRRDGSVKESMSFENIDYQEVYDCDSWYESRLYELYSSRFLFVVFRETDGDITLSSGKKDTRYVVDAVFFWTMPQEDLCLAEEYWRNIRQCVTENRIEASYFWRLGDKRSFHVRPKGRDASDLAANPNGGCARKYCYWFNSEYVRNIIDNHHATI